MVEFLTPAWFELVNASPIAIDPDLDLVLDVVVDQPYRVTARAGAIHVGPCGPDPADVTMTLDRETAALLATGELTAHQAFLAGRVRFSGDVTRLGPIGDAMAALAGVGDATTF